jgi:hypothetical protein
MAIITISHIDSTSTTRCLRRAILLRPVADLAIPVTHPMDIPRASTSNIATALQAASLPTGSGALRTRPQAKASLSPPRQRLLIPTDSILTDYVGHTLTPTRSHTNTHGDTMRMGVMEARPTQTHPV